MAELGKLGRYAAPIAFGLGIGVLARWYMLHIDYRRYPGYPHGWVTHLSLGFIAAALGSIAVPAILEKEFVAVTFLALAAQEFREIREMERKSLEELERSELVPRGPDYIEGIARVFEARNYLVILASLLVTSAFLAAGAAGALAAAVVALVAAGRLMRGEVVGQITTVRPAGLRFDGAMLYVEDIHLMNVGLEESRRIILERGLGVVVEPRDEDAAATMANFGQRQAIAHDTSTILGIRKDVDTPEFTPVVRRKIDGWKIGMFLIPMEKDVDCLVEAVKRVPVLESAKKRPLTTKAGRLAAD